MAAARPRHLSSSSCLVSSRSETPRQQELFSRERGCLLESSPREGSHARETRAQPPAQISKRLPKHTHHPPTTYPSPPAQEAPPRACADRMDVADRPGQWSERVHRSSPLSFPFHSKNRAAGPRSPQKEMTRWRDILEPPGEGQVGLGRSRYSRPPASLFFFFFTRGRTTRGTFSRKTGLASIAY